LNITRELLVEKQTTCNVNQPTTTSRQQQATASEAEIEINFPAVIKGTQ